MQQMVIILVLVAAVPSTARNMTRRARLRQQPREGSATIEGSIRSGSSVVEFDTELLLSPMSMPTSPFGQQLPSTAASSSEDGNNLPLAAAAAATPQVRANVKRVYLANKCGCRANSSTDAPHPIVALSYQPVQVLDYLQTERATTACRASLL